MAWLHTFLTAQSNPENPLDPSAKGTADADLDLSSASPTAPLPLEPLAEAADHRDDSPTSDKPAPARESVRITAASNDTIVGI